MNFFQRWQRAFPGRPIDIPPCSERELIGVVCQTFDDAYRALLIAESQT